jgi:hypothetical protein
MGRHMVTAYTQHLGIVSLELLVKPAERGSLVGSTTGKVQNMERKHHPFVSLELGQRYVTFVDRWQLEIRGRFSNFARHVVSLAIMW